MALKRFVDGAGGAGLLPEARAEDGAGVRAHRRAVVPVRPHRGRGRRRQRGGPGVGRQPRLHRPQPASGPLRRPRPSRRAAGRPRSRSRRAVGRRAVAWRSSCARCSRSSGYTAWPKTSGSAASTSTCASSRAGRTPRCAARRWRWPARWSGARRRSPPASGGRRSATACSSTTTRTPRIARWPRSTRCGHGRTRR